ncbi:MAG: uL22 family ribosomal protein [archaeon]
MSNTEKPLAKEEKKRRGIVKTPKKEKLPSIKASANETGEQIRETAKTEEKKTEEGMQKTDSEGKETKKPAQTKPLVKKTEAVARGLNAHLSTKQSAAICRFIKGKKIETAVEDLEKVIVKKKAVPMKGEIAHRKGRIMSGKYPKKASEYFIKMLKTLNANCSVNGLENPVISEAVANKASKPYGRFGSIQRKRSHIIIKAAEKKQRGKNK